MDLAQNDCGRYISGLRLATASAISEPKAMLANGNPGIPPVSGSGVSGCAVGGVVVSVGVCSNSAQSTMISMVWVSEGIMVIVTVVDWPASIDSPVVVV